MVMWFLFYSMLACCSCLFLMTDAFAVQHPRRMMTPLGSGCGGSNTRDGVFHDGHDKDCASLPKFALYRTRISMCDSAGVPPLATEPPRRVLLIVEPTPFTYVSGYANRFQEMLKYMKKAGDQVHIITPCTDEDAPTEFMGFPITNLKGFNFFLYPDVRISYDIAKKTHDVIRDFRPDVIHVTTPGFIQFRAVEAAATFDIPLVMSYHTDLITYAITYFVVGGFKLPYSKEFAEFMVRKQHKHADLTLVTSSELRRNLNNIGIRRVDVWQKGINVERFSPNFKSREMRKLLTNGHPEAPLLIYVGRLGLEKRLEKLVTVIDENPTVRLAFIGKGPHETELRNLYKKYENVFFAGEFSGDLLSQAYASADIFVMPSDSETLGFVVLEAMASGVPVVGVAAGGVKTLIQSGENGYLTSNEDNMVEFTSKVKYLLDNDQSRLVMGQRAREYTEKFSWEAATSRLRNVQYKLAIDLHRSARDKSSKGRPHMLDIENTLMMNTEMHQ